MAQSAQMLHDSAHTPSRVHPEPRGRRTSLALSTLAALLVLTLVLAGAGPSAAVPDAAETVTETATGTAIVEDGGPLAAELTAELRQMGLPPDIADPFRIDAEILRWADERVPEVSSDRQRLKRLLEALRESRDRTFEYVGGHTGTARETFATGRYNCLSFSALFVATARALGLPAEFYDVPRILEYERQGQLMVLTRHITAAYGASVDREILEFDVGPRVDYRLAQPVDEMRVLGLFYSNRGTELLRQGDHQKAADLLAVAAKLAPDSSQVWANIGVVRRHLEDWDGAEAAYLHAIDLDRTNVPAHHNLLVLWRAQGNTAATERLMALLDQRGVRNPMTFVILGDIQRNTGQITDAGRYYERARKLAPKDAEVLAALGGWYFDLGQTSKAKLLMRKAKKLDPENPRVRELVTRFDTPE